MADTVKDIINLPSVKPCSKPPAEMIIDEDSRTISFEHELGI